MADLINHKTLAIARLITQFKESPNLIAYIETLLLEADTLEGTLQSLLTERTLSEARGTQLDILGVIVGQSRTVIDGSVFDYFGFAGEAQSKSFGSVADAGLGGKFREFGQPTTGNRDLTDEEYRLFISSRILKNTTGATPEEIIAALKFQFGDPLILLQEGVEAEYNISFGRFLTANEKVLLNTDIIPKPAGVRVTYSTEFDPDSFVGFLGIPGALGFADENIVDSGGLFGSVI